MNKRKIPRHQFKHSGWNPSNDPEFQMRKTMDKSERDSFDGLSAEDQRRIVEEWQLAESCEEVGLKLDVE